MTIITVMECNCMTIITVIEGNFMTIITVIQLGGDYLRDDYFTVIKFGAHAYIERDSHSHHSDSGSSQRNLGVSLSVAYTY